MKRFFIALFENLFFKISLLVLSLILLVVAVMTYTALTRENLAIVTLTERTLDLQRETHEESVTARGQSLTRMMAEVAVDEIPALGFDSLNELARIAVADHEVTYAIFLDENNMVFGTHGDYPYLGKSLSQGQVVDDEISVEVYSRAVELGADEFEENFFDVEDEEFLEVASPVLDGEEYLGLVRVGFTLEPMRETISDVEETNQIFAQQKLQESARANLLIAGVSLLLGLLAALFLARRLSRPMVEIMDSMKNAESGDLTTRVQVNSRDEVGQLSKSFNNMMENLGDIFGEILSSSQRLRDSASSLATVVAQNYASVETVSDNMESIDEGAEQNAELVENSSRLVESLNDGAEEITVKNREVMEKSEAMRTDAGAGQRAVNEVVANMETIDAKVSRTREALKRLQSAAADIDQISDSIEFITRKTNLLAYNVSISAAEAGGEQAEEISSIVRQVQNLARESAGATERIKKNVTAIREAGDEVASRMQATDEQADEGVNLAREAGDRLREIVASVERVYKHFSRVTELAENQAEMTGRINRAMSRVSHISSRTSERTRNVSKALEEQTQGLEDVSQAAESLRRQADNLQQLMEDFKV